MTRVSQLNAPWLTLAVPTTQLSYFLPRLLRIVGVRFLLKIDLKLSNCLGDPIPVRIELAEIIVGNGNIASTQRERPREFVFRFVPALSLPERDAEIEMRQWRACVEHDCRSKRRLRTRGL